MVAGRGRFKDVSLREIPKTDSFGQTNNTSPHLKASKDACPDEKGSQGSHSTVEINCNRQLRDLPDPNLK